MEAHWNYRILARKVESEVQFAIYEVHYEDDVPVACTEKCMTPMGFNIELEDPVESIQWQLDAMKLACEKPVLDYDNFPNEYVKYSRKKKLEKIGKLI